MGFGGKIASADLFQNGKIMVDAVNGDDATGQRNNVNKPFATLQAAYGVYQEGDLIEVLSGTYTFTSTWSIPNTPVNIESHFYFHEGAKVEGDFAGALFNVAGVAPNRVVYFHGRGEFINTWNGSNFAGAAISGGPLSFRGAKRIEAGVQGSGFNGCAFLFGTTGNFAIYENIDEILNWRDLGSNLAISTQVLQEEWQGVIRNCKKVGDPNSSSIPLSMAGNIAGMSVLVENSNFYCLDRQALNVSQGTLSYVIDNCVFKTGNRFAGFIAKKGIIQNCHFVNESNGFPTMVVQNGSYLTEDPILKPTFQDCTFVNNGTNVAFSANTGSIFSGTNKFWTAGVNAANGLSGVRDFNKVYGTIVANVMTEVNYSQTWLFNVFQDPPTVGETYTITAPDASTISYVVQVADTRVEVINGLAAAWDADVIANPTGFFAKFDNKALFLGPAVFRLQVTALDPNDGVPPSTPFELTTDGSDTVSTQVQEPAQFAWKGTGKFITDEKLIVPNY